MKPGYFSRFFLAFGLSIVVETAFGAEVRLSDSDPAGSTPVVRLTGQIVGGEAGALQRLLQAGTAAGKTPTVFLASEGGDVDEAMALGRVIRASGAVTVHGYCASACVYAFVGGRERFVASDSILSIHRPTLAEANFALPTVMGTQMLNGLRDYIIGMTGSAAFFEVMMRVPFAEPRALLPSEALAMGVATRLLP